MNVISVAGRIGRDAELRAAGDNQVLGFSVGSDVGWGDKKHTLWFNCSLWGKRAEALHSHLVKGLQVTVVGELDLREWTSETGAGTSLDLKISEVALQGGGGNGTSDQTPAATPSLDQRAASLDDDIPF